MGMKYRGLTTIDMFADISIHGFQIISYITKVNKKYFWGDLKCLDCPGLPTAKKKAQKLMSNKKKGFAINC